ncbi:MAG TPA: bifunctional riboflavin kinase/FAD synthetase [Gemmatimonadales bacterium]|nr:bifunctional riboflavin kinase/FAD synthetase [Gemmatimonadales bacterium]
MTPPPHADEARRRLVRGPTVVTVGGFDGVHVGHRQVLHHMAGAAHRLGARSVLVTFEPHPLQVVNPPAAPLLLTVSAERREILAQCELDVVVFLRFTAELSHYTPDAFVHLLLRLLDVKQLVIGEDHGFGRGRAGDVATLRRLGATLGFAVDVVPPVLVDGRPVSSSHIRRAVAGGDLQTARRLLGRAYSVAATVVPGAGRGRSVGYRTLNLRLPDAPKLLPPDGVYAVHTEWLGGRSGGMMHIGPRPTFADHQRSLEVHLLDADADLYGAHVKVSWVARLRDVMHFPSADALKRQLDRDFQAARSALTASGAPTSH